MSGKISNTYTIYDKSTVFSGVSGNWGLSGVDFFGTQWNDFLMECPICFAGDF